MKACGVTAGDAAGAEPGASPVDRSVSERGNRPWVPSPHASQRAGGKVHRLLMACGAGRSRRSSRGRDDPSQGSGRAGRRAKGGSVILREVLALAVHVSSSGEASGATARRAACRKRRR